MNKADELAKIIWDYMRLHQRLQKADVILTFGTNDLRLADYAAQLYLDGYAPLIVFSGGFGKVNAFERPEAQEFAERAIALGVPRNNIILEEQATNTGENVTLSHRILKENNVNARSILVVHKPYMERRTLATLEKQWPAPQPEFFVVSPPITYEEYFNDCEDKELSLNIMVGDMQRMKTYPKLGFQKSVLIPKKVWAAYQELVAMGYDKYVTKDEV